MKRNRLNSLVYSVTAVLIVIAAVVMVNTAVPATVLFKDFVQRKVIEGPEGLEVIGKPGTGVESYLKLVNSFDAYVPSDNPIDMQGYNSGTATKDRTFFFAQQVAPGFANIIFAGENVDAGEFSAGQVFFWLAFKAAVGTIAGSVLNPSTIGDFFGDITVHARYGTCSGGSVAGSACAQDSTCAGGGACVPTTPRAVLTLAGEVAATPIWQWDTLGEQHAYINNVEVGSIKPDADGIAIEGDLTVEDLDCETSADLLTTDTNGKLVCSGTSSIDVPIALTFYTDKISRQQDINVHGAFQAELTTPTNGQIATGNDVTFTKGLGKIVLTPTGGTDFIGDILITGDTVNRDTGQVSVGDTETITLNGGAGSSDDSTTDSGGNTVWDFPDSFISSKWFFGAITLSTTTVNITAMDVYHVSFEQFNDSADITLDSLDINALYTSTSAELYAHLYTVVVSGTDVVITSAADIVIDSLTGGNRYLRLRRGNLAVAVDGTTDGIFLQMFYERSTQQDWEDVTVKVWAHKTIQLR